jgi:hypothetical protein
MSIKKIYNSIFQVPPKNAKLHNHYQIEKPHQRYQLDLLFMPTDKFGFKYILSLIDCASRYKAATPLKSKDSFHVFNAFKNMIDTDPNLKIPDQIQFDLGSEFNQVSHFMKSNEKTVLKSQNHHAFVESMNRELAKLLFKEMTLKELKTKKTSKAWVDNLPDAINELNNRYTRMIKMTPNEAIKLKIVPQPENEFDKETASLHFPIGSKVRYLLKPDEYLNVVNNKITKERKRATDPNYSLTVYRVIKLIKDNEHSLFMHQLNDRPGNLYNYFELISV